MAYGIIHGFRQLLIQLSYKQNEQAKKNLSLCLAV